MQSIVQSFKQLCCLVLLPKSIVLIKFARLLKYFTITELNARWRRRRIRRRLFFAPSSSFQKVLLLCLYFSACEVDEDETTTNIRKKATTRKHFSSSSSKEEEKTKKTKVVVSSRGRQKRADAKDFSIDCDKDNESWSKRSDASGGIERNEEEAKKFVDC